MYASTVFAAIIAVAVAVPTNWEDDNKGPSASVGDVCGNGNTIQCCNAETANKAVGGLLGNLDLSNLLAGCNDITATIIGAAVPIKDQCKQEAICCGEQKQNVSQRFQQELRYKYLHRYRVLSTLAALPSTSSKRSTLAPRLLSTLYSRI